MVGMALPMPVVRSSSRVAPPQDGQTQVPLGSELHLLASSTWSHGSGYHSKTSVSRYPSLMHTHNTGNFEVCGRLLV